MGNGILSNFDPSKTCQVSRIRLINEKGDFIVPRSDIIFFYNRESSYYDVVSMPGITDFSITVGGSGGYKHQ